MNGTNTVYINELINTDLLDLIYRTNGYNPEGATVSALMGGFNMLGGRIPMPKNEDHVGYSFFTKPDLRLSYDNISSIRMLAKFTNEDPNTMSAALRCSLSPTGLFTQGPNSLFASKYRSNIVDDKSPFIHILSNTVDTITGWPDKLASYYQSNRGIGGEQISMVDGRPDYYGATTLTATFDNLKGDVVLDMISGWVEYQLNVAQGSIDPYPYYLASNRLDYQTRITVVLMDTSKRFIQKFACAPAAFPVNDPSGAPFNIGRDTKFSTEGDKIVTQFVTSGIIYNDPILIYEFNRLVAMYNPRMKADKSTISNDMVKVDGYLENTAYIQKSLFNFKCYPYMAERQGELELEWYTPKEEYDAIVQRIKDMKRKIGDNSKKDKVTPWKDSLYIPPTKNP